MGSINAIFAVTPSGGLGYRGSLPWPHCPEDLAWFKAHTENQIVVMGRKTFDSPGMPKPLPKRINIVFTNRFINMDKVYCVSGDYCEQVKKVQKEFPNKEIFIIGGKEVIEATRPIVDTLYLTNFKSAYKIDVKINMREYMHGFRLMSTTPHEVCTFNIYKNTA